MAGNPLDIGTEDARKSLNQSLVDLYEGNVQAGGAFNAKEITTDGSRASLQKGGSPSLQSAQYTPSGFKTKMQLFMTEMNAKSFDWAKSFYGHSNAKYMTNTRLR